ncbi:unnamed protein product [Calicophoron daubneyi]|uniref:Uncharacterized protein n=1 Tax=Calicophoron daubneyi TaxID=300641 RepID=A0AAV2T6C4_CALDB
MKLTLVTPNRVRSGDPVYVQFIPYLPNSQTLVILVLFTPPIATRRRNSPKSRVACRRKLSVEVKSMPRLQSPPLSNPDSIRGFAVAWEQRRQT